MVENGEEVLIRNKAQYIFLKVCLKRLISKPKVGKWKLEEFDDHFDINLSRILPDVEAASGQEGLHLEEDR